MRIVYRDIAEEFIGLLQSCMNRRDKIASIDVTRPELTALLKHKDASKFLGDYIVQRNVKEQEIRQRMFKLGQELERVTSQDERQRIWDETSTCEEELHKLFNDIPTELTQSGIRIRVTLKG